MLDELALLLEASGVIFNRQWRCLYGETTPWSAWLSNTGYAIMFRADANDDSKKPRSLGVQAAFDLILKCEARR